MTPSELIVEAYKSAHFAGELTEQLYEASLEGAEVNVETAATLLEQARSLNASAQALEQLARGHKSPKVSP